MTAKLTINDADALGLTTCASSPSIGGGNVQVKSGLVGPGLPGLLSLRAR